MQAAIVKPGDLLDVHESSVHDLIVEQGRCVGIIDEEGVHLRAKSVVLTSGTFLGGQCHIGLESMPAGRFMRTKKMESGIQMEPPANALTKSIKSLNFPTSRLKTGTPPRLSRKTIDYSGLEV
jgi:tRNA uridine 5-carboxymethylaminomethyl modification enzyme